MQRMKGQTGNQGEYLASIDADKIPLFFFSFLAVYLTSKLFSRNVLNEEQQRVSSFIRE